MNQEDTAMKEHFCCAEAERTNKCIKVLAVGNSFSQDSTTFLRHMTCHGDGSG